MIYNDFKGRKLSALGFGAMRLPVLDGDNSKIDEQRAGEMVDCAMEKGINYYDTAWGYHGENSEVVIGRLLSKYPRDSYYLATKFPGYDLSNMEKAASIFPRQLEKCGVEYFDFYLLHNVCELNIDHYLDEKLGVVDYLLERKAEGKIRCLGFSAHGEYGVVKRLLDAYGDQMEFGQLQINWVDWSFQKACDRVALLHEYGLPVIAMEPLRGGKLARLPQGAEDRLKALEPQASAAWWAFAFTQSLPDVMVTLSGMSTLDQVKENVALFERRLPLSPEGRDALIGVAQDMIREGTVPCTSCGYCLDHCPRKLDIPRLMWLYSENAFTGGSYLVRSALRALEEEKRPGACLACGACEAVCPQKIEISGVMAKLSDVK